MYALRRNISRNYLIQFIGLKYKKEQKQTINNPRQLFQTHAVFLLSNEEYHLFVAILSVDFMSIRWFSIHDEKTFYFIREMKIPSFISSEGQDSKLPAYFIWRTALSEKNYR
jgi:hypothetical protein